jgi:zinc and cadmium transporter
VKRDKMIEALAWSLLATLIVSLMSLAGIITIGIKPKVLDKILLLLVGFSAGALMGGAFFHLMPESVEASGFEFTAIIVIIGFVLFFLVERLLHWHHCHEHGGKCDVHTFTYMNLIGDGIHNFIDGLIIAAGFSASFEIGIATTIAVISHEIPQEIGDFGVLVYGGFSKLKALLFNFLSAITAILGAIVGVVMVSITDSFISILIPFAAGGFIYIFASDLIPELHKEPKLSKSMMSFLFFTFGIIFMYLVKILLEH